MNKNPDSNLSKRERQIMDIIYKKGEATALEVQELIADQPSYSTIRALLKILEDKGHLMHTQDGAKYIYKPIVSREKAKKSALSHLMHTFFDNSTESVVATLMDISGSNLSEDEFAKLEKLIENSRKEGK